MIWDVHIRIRILVRIGSGGLPEVIYSIPRPVGRDFGSS